MSQKSDLYNALKDSGAKLTTSYQRYTVDELAFELSQVTGKPVQPKPAPAQTPVPAPDLEALAAAYQEFTQESEPEDYISDRTEPQPPAAPRSNVADPNEMPGQRLNTKADEDIIRIDDQGRAWLQEEVRKPAYPKPRGRRVLKYMETGVKTQTVQNGEYVETFEVAGEGVGRPAEVKITLPSYQVGIYRDPRFPFKVHIYNEVAGFDLFEVNDFYGGSELVPDICKRIYVENDLCYDIRSVIRAIQNEHRQLQLAGRIPA